MGTAPEFYGDLVSTVTVALSEVTLETVCLTCERTRGRKEEEILQGRRYRGPKGSVAMVFGLTRKPLMYLVSCSLEVVLATGTEAEQQNSFSSSFDFHLVLL